MARIILFFILSFKEAKLNFNQNINFLEVKIIRKKINK
jgi:hypothetical protein